MTKLNNTLQNNPVSNQLLDSDQDGYALTWDNTDSEWKAEPQAIIFDDSIPGTNDNIIKNGGQSPIDNTQMGIVNLGDFSQKGFEYFISDVVSIGGGANIVTSTPHTFSTGNLVSISGIVGPTAANGIFIVTYVPDNTHLDIKAIIGSTIQLVQQDPAGSSEIEIVDIDIGPLVTGDNVTISNVLGTTEANGNWTITMDTWSISDIVADGVSGYCEITLTTPFPLGPSFYDFGLVVSGVVGTTEANGRFNVIQVVDSTHIILYNVTFINTYISGGTITSQNSFLLNGSTFVNNYISDGQTQYATYISGGVIEPYSGVYGSYSSILGGNQNYVDGYYNLIISGNQNSIYHNPNNYPPIGNIITGGTLNVIATSNDGYNIINGGSDNTIGQDGYDQYGNNGVDFPDTSQYNYIEGSGNFIANGSDYNHIEGQDLQLFNNAVNNHIEGTDIFIDGSTTSCHIEGNSHTANNGVSYSHIEGSGNQLNDGSSFCHVEGENNNIINNVVGLHVEGTLNNALGGTDWAHIQGEYAQGAHESQDVMASGAFSVVGDAQVSNLVFRGTGVGTFNLGFGIIPGNLPLFSAVTSIQVEAVAQDITIGAGGDYAAWNQTHLVSGYSGGTPFPAQYNGCAPYMGQGGTIISTVSNTQVYSGDSTSIQITTNNTNTYIVGQTVVIYGILGTTEANGTWIISVIVDANNFVLQGSTFSNVYISGGVVQQNYVNIYTTLNNSNGGPPTVALNNSDNPYQNWIITAGLDGINFFQLTFTDNSGGTDTIAVVANVRFVENNAT